MRANITHVHDRICMERGLTKQDGIIESYPIPQTTAILQFRYILVVCDFYMTFTMRQSICHVILWWL